MNKLKYIWIVAAMIVALSACTISYKLNGAAIDYSIYKLSLIHISEPTRPY